MNNLIIGHTYSRSQIAQSVNEKGISISREGIYYLDGKVILFVTLDKTSKSNMKLCYNDYFIDDLFHWDSQNKQHINTPRIQEIVRGDREVHLFARVHEKQKSTSLPFVYCGRLHYLSHDENTKNPVHMIFQSIDYQDFPNSFLQDIYTWKPDSKQISTAQPPTPEVIKKSFQNKKKSSQGYIKDAEVKKSIELRAMQLAIETYQSHGYEVLDVSSTESVDLLCTKNEEARYVEVKGTQGLGEEILLTANEIKRAKSGLYTTDLFIVHSINVIKSNNSIQASEGISLIIENWIPDDKDLVPTHFRYTVK